MALTLTKTMDTTYGRVYAVFGTITFGVGDTYSTGGNTLNFRTQTIKATKKPLGVVMYGNAGYAYVYVPGTNSSDGKIKVFTGAAAQAALTELTAGAVPGAVSSDTIYFKAEFQGML